MITSPINYNARGDVWITRIDSKSKHLVFEDHNLILENAKKIFVNAIGGNAFVVDTIQVKKSGGLLAEATVMVDFPAGDDKVRFTARFDEASFNDTLDEIRLVSSAGGDFAEITGLSIAKDSLNQLEIVWQVTLNNL